MSGFAFRPDPKPVRSAGGMGRPKRNTPLKVSRARILEIKQRKCQSCRLCGATESVNAHHLVPRGMGGTIGGEWTESNVVGLCGHGNVDGCHALIEARDPAACYLLRARLSDAEYSYVVSKMGEGWLELRYPLLPAEFVCADPEGSWIADVRASQPQAERANKDSRVAG